MLKRARLSKEAKVDQRGFGGVRVQEREEKHKLTTTHSVPDLLCGEPVLDFTLVSMMAYLVLTIIFIALIRFRPHHSYACFTN